MFRHLKLALMLLLIVDLVSSFHHLGVEAACPKKKCPSSSCPHEEKESKSKCPKEKPKTKDKCSPPTKAGKLNIVKKAVSQNTVTAKCETADKPVVKACYCSKVCHGGDACKPKYKACI